MTTEQKSCSTSFRFAPRREMRRGWVDTHALSLRAGADVASWLGLDMMLWSSPDAAQPSRGATKRVRFVWEQMGGLVGGEAGGGVPLFSGRAGQGSRGRSEWSALSVQPRLGRVGSAQVLGLIGLPSCACGGCWMPSMRCKGGRPPGSRKVVKNRVGWLQN